MAGKTDTKTPSANDQPKLEAANGTSGQIAKFTSATDLGNSVMTEKNGSVGIGTVNPEGLFHVHGTSGGISTGITSSGSGAGFFFRNRETATATDYWAWYSSGNIARFWRSGVGDLLSIKTDGNVGIGTAASGYKLDVGGPLRAVRGISNDLVVETTGSTNAWAKMWMITPGQKWAMGTSQNYNGNQFYIHDATFNQIRMSIQPNAGEIAFPSPSSNHIVVQTSGGTNAWAQLRVQTTNQRWAIGSSQNYNDDQLYFTDDSRRQIRMVIQTNGNVGIGTTHPQAKLDVAGQTRTESLEITGGADFAENFDVNSTLPDSQMIKAGMVVSIAQAGNAYYRQSEHQLFLNVNPNSRAS